MKRRADAVGKTWNRDYWLILGGLCLATAVSACRRGEAPEASSIAARGGPTPIGSSPHGSTEIVHSQFQFSQLAHTAEDEEGELKFTITKFRTGRPEIYFQDAKAYPWHVEFVNELESKSLTPTLFSSQCLAEDKDYVCGYVKYVKKFGYLWFLPEKDRVKPVDVVKIHEMIKWRLPLDSHFDMIGGGGWTHRFKTFWHPQGNTQEQMIALPDLGEVPSKLVSDLVEKGEEKILNPGFTIGQVRYIKSEEELTSIAPTDIVILDFLPLDLPPVAGIITSFDQPQLSHINLLARGRGTPNFYAESALRNPRYLNLKGRKAKLYARGKIVRIVPASDEEFNNFWSVKRPTKLTALTLGSAAQNPVDLMSVNMNRQYFLDNYGAKGTNLRELKTLFPDDTPRYLLGLPYSAYLQHLTRNGLVTELRQMLANSQFQRDSAYRAKALKSFQKKIKKAKVDPSLLSDLAAKLRRVNTDNHGIRFRSSSNAEDTEFFSGAGLYTSKTGYLNPPPPKPGKKPKTLEKAIKKVWASLWNFHAFEEREFFRVDHFSTAMGIVIHPSYPSAVEKANGVTTTRCTRFTCWVTLNLAQGDKSVTNPVLDDPRPIASMMVGLSLQTDSFEEIPDADAYDKIINRSELEFSVRTLVAAHNHFKSIYSLGEHDSLDYEVKWVGDSRRFVVKQARPIRRYKSTINTPPGLKSKEEYYAPYIYLSTVKGNVLRYTEENYGLDLRKEPNTGYIRIELLQDVAAVGKKGDAFEFFADEDQGTTIISHPFMHHGPYDLGIYSVDHPIIQEFRVDVGGDVRINGKRAGRVGPPEHEILFRNWPLIYEGEMDPNKRR